MVARRLTLLAVALASACSRQEGGPIRVVAVGGPAVMADANRVPLGPGSALLLDSVAQGLVRFDASGEIEPALAQSWIVSDDGLRYTFRLRRANWTRGEPVTAAQVVDRLKAVVARTSRNPLRQVLGVVDEIEAMTDSVLEIRLKSPRPNFLQLLAQPEMTIAAVDQGTGPFRLGAEPDDSTLRLVLPRTEEEEDAAPPPEVLLETAPAGEAIARFGTGAAEMVTGGTTGDLPLLIAADPPATAVVGDPVRGLLGLAFMRADGLLGDAAFRQALDMAIDRDAIAQRFGRFAFQPRLTLLPAGLTELPQPSGPGWAGGTPAARRTFASSAVAQLARGQVPRLRVALPNGLGYRLMFAQVRRDWRAIGVEAVAVAANAEADLRLVDEVAPADLAPWYLRHFMCGAAPVCDATGSFLLATARTAPTPEDRVALLALADRAFAGSSVFISLGSPVRWSLRSPRLNGLRANVFAHHALSELIDPGE